MGRLQLQRVREEAERQAEGKDWTGRIVKVMTLLIDRYSVKLSCKVKLTQQVVPGRGSLPETRLPTCKECGEELCDGLCKDYLYMNYTRLQTVEKKEEESGLDAEEVGTPKAKGKKKRRTKRRKKKKKKESEYPDDDADDEDE
ncbi:putative Myb-binding protein 1A-like 2 [Homarus americanus]|uniref:Putative Myb-binding protein 1A-like 2 n=1 Tax=Homarus americanus TaxID=6706 RepID=A0A8J5MKH2_HOMAM|nr:putative Myb-binding protein 1A-like 2 [Homarus americanus]